MSEYESRSERQARTAFVFGCGYLGIRVARQLVSDSWKVTALTRSPERAKSLASQGIRPIVGDWTNSSCLRSPDVSGVLEDGAARVLISVGYDNKSRQDRHRVYVDGLRNALGIIPPSSEVVYVSSTGVFHQTDGYWVDETSPCHPSRDGGAAHLHAEQLLWKYRPATPQQKTVILRMAGLYGPGRVPRVDSIRLGQPIAADPEGYLNLIHIDDAARCVIAAWQHPSPQRLYLISDGTPVKRGKYFEEISQIVGGPRVRYSGEAGPRSDSSKRIWNQRMRRDLLNRLEYPSYREGLRAILGS